MCGGDPCGYCIPRLLGDLDLHWSLVLFCMTIARLAM